MLKGYKGLKVWERSYRLCLTVYRITRSFPAQERFGIASQMQRAAVSVPSNVAEAYGRGTTAEFLRGSRVAYGSLAELETQLLIAADLHYVKPAERDAVLAEIHEIELMLKALIKSLERRRDSAPLDLSVSRSLRQPHRQTDAQQNH